MSSTTAESIMKGLFLNIDIGLDVQDRILPVGLFPTLASLLRGEPVAMAKETPSDEVIVAVSSFIFM